MLLRSRANFRNIRSEGRLSNRQAQRHYSIAIGLIIPRLKVSSVDEKKSYGVEQEVSDDCVLHDSAAVYWYW
ncbi:hypothetical protein ACHAWO_001424 [Cyclotella atomus]|uniref:Uncharacterized protein n=1 Tax=Cyclotella atomus TaxID=382360 RepID=A0ABD3NNM2_9STRA